METREVCTCTECRNESEMVFSCEWVDVESSEDELSRKSLSQLRQTKVCAVCGNEAEMLIATDH